MAPHNTTQHTDCLTHRLSCFIRRPAVCVRCIDYWAARRGWREGARRGNWHTKHRQEGPGGAAWRSPVTDHIDWLGWEVKTIVPVAFSRHCKYEWIHVYGFLTTHDITADVCLSVCRTST